MTKPVLVVGAGPVGLTMAAELARYRVPVRIIDKTSARTDKSKALAVWPRTLELLDRAGCAAAFTATGLAAKAINLMAGSKAIARVNFDEVASAFNYALMIPQSESERLLEAHLESFGIHVERNVELMSFTETADGVSCSVDGKTLEASWLIGCDGAHSTVRHALGMTFDGDTLATNFILADLHVTGLQVPSDELAICLHAEGVVVFFPMSPTRYRVIADVGSGPRHEPALDDVQAIVDRRGPGGVTLSNPIWLSGFSVNERKVEQYRSGRVFVAGDAAHVHSPAGGQGMNTGMQDAFNLAWKLALVEHGHANASLLDSYSVERSAVAEQILSDSGRLTRAGTLRNHVAQDVRNFIAHHLLGLTAVKHAIADRLSEITIGYPHSPLNVGAHAGKRVVGPFGTGDVPRFAVLANQNVVTLLTRHAALLEPLSRPAPDDEVWLVRPDGYAVATGDVRVIDDWLSALTATQPLPETARN